MTRLKGKVISRPLTGVPKEGNQVVRYRYGDKAKGILSIEIVETVDSLERIGFKAGGWQYSFNDLYELCIQHKVETPEPWIDFKDVVVPLKYSQWQAAIDNGEVDSDKEVEFEAIRIYPGRGSGLANCKHIAKIIPAKKEKLYTQTELEMKCKMAHHYGTIGRKFEDFIALHLK